MMLKCKNRSEPPAVEGAAETSVGMGSATLAAAPARLTAVLGSCVGVAIYCPELGLGMLSHVVLPHSNGSRACPAKFADTAVTYMRSVLEERGAKPGGLVAKIAGGARMFGDGVHTRIGESNVAAVVGALESAGIRIVGREVGGALGRRISFDLAGGQVTVESIGQKPHTI